MSRRLILSTPLVLVLGAVLLPAPTAGSAQPTIVAPDAWTTLLAGQDDLLGIVGATGAFVSVQRQGATTEIALDLAADGHLGATLDEEARSAVLRFVDARGVPRPITPLDLAAMATVRQAMALYPEIGNSELAAPVLRLLDWIADAPPNYVLDLGFENARLRSLCKKIDKTVTARWDFTGGSDIKKATLGPCNQGKCFGRCGQGCGGDPGPGPSVQQFTQDCLNHDACVESLGYAAPGCQDEFSATADDVLYAPDCNAIEGSWKLIYKTSPAVSARALQFGMIGETFVGNAEVAQGRSVTVQGVRGAPPALDATTIQVPLWKSVQCRSEPFGFATAQLKGTNYCGTIRARLVKGSWPGYNTASCQPIDPYSWTGKVTIKRTKW